MPVGIITCHTPLPLQARSRQAQYCTSGQTKTATILHSGHSKTATILHLRPQQDSHNTASQFRASQVQYCPLCHNIAGIILHLWPYQGSHISPLYARQEQARYCTSDQTQAGTALNCSQTQTGTYQTKAGKFFTSCNTILHHR